MVIAGRRIRAGLVVEKSKKIRPPEPRRSLGAHWGVRFAWCSSPSLLLSSQFSDQSWNGLVEAPSRCQDRAGNNRQEQTCVPTPWKLWPLFPLQPIPRSYLAVAISHCDGPLPTTSTICRRPPCTTTDGCESGGSEGTRHMHKFLCRTECPPASGSLTRGRQARLCPESSCLSR